MLTPLIFFVKNAQKYVVLWVVVATNIVNSIRERLFAKIYY